MTEKVIEFPKHKVVREVPEEQIKAAEARRDQKFADTVVEEITGIIITELDNYYIEMENKQFSKDIILVVDALKAAVYRQLGIDHHLHDFVDNNVKIIEGDIDGMTKEEIQTKISSLIEELKTASADLDKEDKE